jgi:signal transduction histidine kinase/ligand-binding sensor domain-containing protein
MLLWVLCLWLAPVSWTLAGQAGAPVADAALPASAEFGFAEPYFEAISQPESLPGGVVAALLQDQRGLLWVGTQQGLVRYDGYSTRRFVHIASDRFSLSGNFVRALAQGRAGKIWVGTVGDGMSLFDPEREQFEQMRHDPARPGSLSGNQVNSIVTDASGNLWVATNGGLDYLAFDSTDFVHYRHDPARPDSLRDDDVRAVLLDRDGRLWVGGPEGLQRLRPDRTGFETIIDSAGKSAVAEVRAGHNIGKLFQAADGKLWIGTISRGAAWLDQDGRSLHWLPLRNEIGPPTGDGAALHHGWIVAIAQPDPAHIWLGSAGGGISIVAASDGTVLRQLRHDPAIAGSLALDNLGALLPDRSGLLWVGTWGGGLQRYQVANRAIRSLRHSPGKPQGPSHPEITSVLELLDGKILLGTAGNGIDVIDRQAGRIGGYRPLRSGRSDPRWPGLPDGAVWAMVQQADGTLWVGTRQAGVLRLAPGARAWQVFGTASGLPDVRLSSLLLTRAGQLWVGTVRGPARWQADTERFVPVPTHTGDMLRSNVNAMTEDRTGAVWIGSNIGLWQFRAGGSAMQPHLHDPMRSTSLRADRINGLLVDSHDTLWIATADGLDWCIGEKGGQAEFGHVADTGEAEGRRVGQNLLEDGSGRIWSETFVYDPKRGLLQELSQADGLELGSSRVGSRATTRDGYLIFGGTQGVVLIDPVRFVPWHYQPDLVVTHFQVNGRYHAPGTLALARPQALELAAGLHSFSIEFAALDYSRPQKNRYRYRLMGHDSDFIMTDATHRTASYGNLWPGDYRLQIEGSNRNGQWSGQRLDIAIRVLPAFWQTPWFAALLLFALAGAMAGALRLQRARLRGQARALEATVAQRTAEIARAHHELVQTHAELASAHQDLKQTQHQLVLREKMAGLGTLTAGVAHEINNPTNFAHVAAQNQRANLIEFEQFVGQLFDDEVDPAIVQAFSQRFAELQSNVNTMLNGTDRIKAIVKDLRSFTRLDEAEKKTVHLSECLTATVNLVRTSWQEQVEFISEFSDDPPCECWPALLNQVAMNLLVNGCQAIAARRMADGSGAKGHLWLRLRENAGWLAVQIEDDGIGMSPQLQQRILEPFFTTREVGSGSGMGLAISYGIIQKHGGRLDIVSTPGQGSCFTLHLPVTG